MKELTREHRAILNFKLASAQVRAIVGDEENIMFTRFYDAFEGGISYFIQSELNIRQGERCRALGVKPEIQSAALAQGAKLNKKGIEMLGISQAMLGEFIKTIAKEEPSTDVKFQAKLKEFQVDVREILSDLEIKASDAKEIDGVLTEVIAAAGPGKTSKDLAAFLAAKVKALAEVRGTAGRGAETNIAIWKLVAAATLLALAIWVVYKCYYSRWRCSKSEKAVYDTILAFAMVVFCACE
ncbi:MAG: hypothetical protein HZA47_11080 [Planctomycetes bacterium]|uniref:hypothetical protein n=1 Tax=Candidatus Wunengus sp. YC65 TaxID=3367701 RepID=UPI001DC88A77|nr:hypothetical protein [Planctomycetota bacterium]